ncbi:MAG: diguanylate cyclase [Pseudomonadota bacterium]
MAETAPVSAERAHKLTAQYLRNHRLVAASYALDGFGMLLFWLVGTVSWMPALFYTAIGIGLCLVAMAITRLGWNQRSRDPSLVLPLSMISAVLQLLCMVLFPQINFMYVLILFVVYISLTLLVPVRQAIVACIFTSLGMLLALGLSGTRVRIPDANLAEQLVALGFFALTLLRCIYLGTHNTRMTRQIKKRSAELAELTAKVERLALHDELTGLLNRRSLMTILAEEQQRADRMGTKFSTAILDLDKFKQVNDTMGHLAGDKTLQIFARAAQHKARETDRIGRYGGEEFLMVLTGTAADAARIPVDRLRETLEASDWSEVGPGFGITFSCGIAGYQSGETIDSLIKRADDALYRAKSEGRNCTRLA